VTPLPPTAARTTWFQPAAAWVGRSPAQRVAGWFGAWLLALLVIGALLGPGQARAQGAELTTFELTRGDEGVLLSYAVKLELPRGAEEALNKAVPLYFVAEAEVFRDRWYWRDQSVAQASRVWRIVYQPLTLSYRVTFGGLSQTYPNRGEALAAISRNARWRIVEPGAADDGGRHYVEFSFRLDTSLLPRPMQIGISGQADWTLKIDRIQRFN
jgi:Domain of unknown function (DUF4390)